jgi:phosphoribosylcarboxyaminoimidazole (NCAIR) mutase
MAIGKAGAKNAGLFAVQLLAVTDQALAERMAKARTLMAEAVAEKSERLQQRLRADGLL